jgi:hypothetical protein
VLAFVRVASFSFAWVLAVDIAVMGGYGVVSWQGGSLLTWAFPLTRRGRVDAVGVAFAAT